MNSVPKRARSNHTRSDSGTDAKEVDLVTRPSTETMQVEETPPTSASTRADTSSKGLHTRKPTGSYTPSRGYKRRNSGMVANHPPASPPRHDMMRMIKSIVKPEFIDLPVAQVFINHLQPILNRQLLREMCQVLEQDSSTHTSYDRFCSVFDRHGTRRHDQLAEDAEVAYKNFPQPELKEELAFNDWHYNGEAYESTVKTYDMPSHPPKFNYMRTSQGEPFREVGPSGLLAAFLRTKHAYKQPCDVHRLEILRSFPVGIGCRGCQRTNEDSRRTGSRDFRPGSRLRVG